MTSRAAATASTDVAIIGVAGRFPGAATIDQFWNNLCAGVESVRTFSAAELINAGLDPAIVGRADYVRAGAVLDDIESFDAELFGYSPRAAELIEPQHRLFLECAWEALEDAGIDPKRFSGRIGVFGGVTMNTYLLHNVLAGRPELLRQWGALQIEHDKDFVPTRVSYKLNLRGPSVAVQTACSTSLVAVHLGCQSLLSGESDVVLAGGVSVTVPRLAGYFAVEGGINSTDGRCLAFGRGANGTVRGRGAGLVVMARLEDVARHRWQNYAIIKGSAINNDGSAKVGYTAPSVEGQVAVIADALESADVCPEDVSYIETHGTGTQLGDPMEVAALTQAFGDAKPRGSCPIGSLKPNIGHLDVAAGVAGLIKAALALRHRRIPASINCDEPNPEIDFAASPFYVNTRTRAWDAPAPRRAGVSSFGVGGTNAHVVLEESPDPPARDAAPAPEVLTLSANSPSALHRMRDRLADTLERTRDVPLQDISFTLQTGRQQLPYRAAAVCTSIDDAIVALRRGESMVRGLAAGERPTVVFAFPGQGGQLPTMTRELYDTQPFFRRTIDECAEIGVTAGLDIPGLLGLSRSPTAHGALRETEHLQPALFAFEYALARLWMHWGVQPTAVVGHSLGEYLAASIAGLWTLSDGLRAVAARGRLMQATPPGGMLAVALSEAEAGERVQRFGLAIAAINGPRSCVLSGREEALECVARELGERGIPSRRLEATRAFHSPLIDTILPSLRETMSRVAFEEPSIPVLSNVTGDWIRPGEMQSPDYWVAHARRTVRFNDNLRRASALARATILEVGPGGALGRLAAIHRSDDGLVVSSLPVDRRAAGNGLLPALAQLWAAGAPVEWTAVREQSDASITSLPTYPFERRRLWISPADPAVGRPAAPLSRVVRRVWHRTPSPSRRGSGARHYVLIGRDTVRAVAQTLESSGQIVTLVTPGREFHAEGPARYTVRETETADYQRVWDAVGAVHRDALVIVLCWTLDACCHDAHGEEACWTALRATRCALDAFSECDTALPPIVCTATADDLLGTESVCPLRRAGVAGAWTRTGTSFSVIDVGNGEADTATQWLADELRHYDALDRFVARRNGQRWRRSDACIDLSGEPAAAPIQDASGDRLGPLFDPLATVRSVEAASSRHQIAAMSSYAGLEEELISLCAKHVLEYLSACGVGAQHVQSISIEALRRSLRVIPHYWRLLDAMVDTLVTARVADRLGEGMAFTALASQGESAADQTARVLDRFPDFAGLIAFLAHCAGSYRAVLSGEMDGVGVLYPDGNRALLAATAERTIPHSSRRIYQDVLCERLTEAAARARRPLRVLEVGCGTGILTWALAPGVVASGGQYVATDIGRAFVLDIEREARRRSIKGIRGEVFDIAAGSAGTRVAGQRFDVVVGLDVVHATADIATTLRNLDAMLDDDGALCLVEATHTQPWIDLSFGLAPGWWTYTDTRSSGPLLSAERWAQALAAVGSFATVQTYPSGETGSASDYVLAIARKRPAARASAEGPVVLRGPIGEEPSLEAQLALAGASPVVYIAPTGGRAPERDLRRDLDRLAEARSESAVDLLLLVPRRGSSADWAVPAATCDVAVIEAARRGVAGYTTSGTIDEDAPLPPLDPWSSDVIRVCCRAHTYGLRIEWSDRPAVAPAGEPLADVEFHPRPTSVAEYVEPRTSIERVLATLWAETMGVERIGITDDFYELGGDSLLALRLTARISDELGIRLPARAIAETPTISGLAELLNDLREVAVQDDAASPAELDAHGTPP